MAAITLPAEIASVVRGIGFVVDCAAAEGFSPEGIARIELAVEEALVNICQHAYHDAAGTMEIRCTQGEAQNFLIELMDAGKPFNVLEQPLPDLQPDIEQRPVGGLGVLLIRSLVDTVVYRRDANRNILQLIVQRSC
jgi:anti-sigma regulatory factor (Ser/Thr protein kinase)